MSLINSKTFEHYFRDVELKPGKSNVRVADGSNVQVIGRCKLPMELGGKSVLGEFVITDGIKDIIIGMDGIHAFGAKIDSQEETIEAGGIKQPLFMWEQHLKEIVKPITCMDDEIKLKSLTTRWIKPGHVTQLDVQVDLEKNVYEGELMYIEDIATPGIRVHIVPGIQEVKNKTLRIEVVNNTKEGIRIGGRQVIARASRLIEGMDSVSIFTIEDVKENPGIRQDFEWVYKQIEQISWKEDTNLDDSQV